MGLSTLGVISLSLLLGSSVDFQLMMSYPVFVSAGHWVMDVLPRLPSFMLRGSVCVNTNFVPANLWRLTILHGLLIAKHWPQLWCQRWLWQWWQGANDCKTWSFFSNCLSQHAKYCNFSMAVIAGCPLEYYLTYFSRVSCNSESWMEALPLFIGAPVVPVLSLLISGQQQCCLSIWQQCKGLS